MENFEHSKNVPTTYYKEDASMIYESIQTFFQHNVFTNIVRGQTEFKSQTKKGSENQLLSDVKSQLDELF